MCLSFIVIPLQYVAETHKLKVSFYYKDRKIICLETSLSAFLPIPVWNP